MPESQEVTKNTITSTMPTRLEICASGSSRSVANSFKGSSASAAARLPPTTSWSIAKVPKAVNHTTDTRDGSITTKKTVWRTVRPREMRAMNMPTNGAHAVHQAQ